VRVAGRPEDGETPARHLGGVSEVFTRLMRETSSTKELERPVEAKEEKKPSSVA
jgi:hypothetical protein